MKPIAPGSAAQVAGRAVHVRCLTQETRRAASAQQKAASQAREQAEALVQRASELVAHASVRNRICPVCEQPLTEGGSLLFQGDVLVHAACWRARGSQHEGAR